MQTVILFCCLVIRIIFQFTRLGSSVGKMLASYASGPQDQYSHEVYIFFSLFL